MRITTALLITLILGSFAFDVSAQGRRSKSGRHYQDMFPKEPQYSLGYWYYAVGATYMLPSFNSEEQTLLNTDTETYTVSANPSGRFWGALEVGRYKFFQYPGFFKYFDYGLSYRGFSGRETYTGTLMVQDSIMSNDEGSNSFLDHQISGHFNLNQITELTDFHFLQNTIGVNADYTILSSRTQELNVPGGDVSAPGSVTGALHYKLSLGWKPNNRTLVLLGLETPLVHAYPVQDDPLHIKYFASKYRPMILSIRIMPLNPYREKNCAPVKTRDGSRLPTDMMR